MEKSEQIGLEEILKQPVTRENWQELMVHSLAYGVIKGRSHIHKFYYGKDFLKLSFDEREHDYLLRNNVLLKKCQSLKDKHLDIFSIIRQYAHQNDLTRINDDNLKLNSIRNHYYLILAAEKFKDQFDSRELFYKYLDINQGSFTTPEFSKNLCFLLDFYSTRLNSKNTNTIIGIDNDKLSKINHLINDILDKKNGSQANLKFISETLHNPLFDYKKYYILSMIMHPTEKPKSVSSLIISDENDQEYSSQLGRESCNDGLDFILDLFSLFEEIDHKKDFKFHWINSNPYNLLEQLETQLKSKKDYALRYDGDPSSFKSSLLFDSDLAPLLRFNLEKIRKGNFPLFTYHNINYLLEPVSESFSELPESHYAISLESLSNRIRIIKKLAEENREVDYETVSKLADIGIPDYLAIEKKGEGGTSRVYECINEKLPYRTRALRIFETGITNSSSAEGIIKEHGSFGLFERGMRLQEELAKDFDFVTQVYDWGKLKDGRLFSVEELIDHTLEDEFNLPIEERIRLFRIRFPSIFEAINILHHEVGILHTDITLSNIGIIRKRDSISARKSPSKEEIKLLDFQSALNLNSEKRNYFCGSRQYSAPEVILNNDYSEKSDIYSLSVCMFRYLTGEFPTDYGIINNEREHLEELRMRLSNPEFKNEHNKNIIEACKLFPINDYRKFLTMGLQWDKDRRQETLCL